MVSEKKAIRDARGLKSAVKIKENPPFDLNKTYFIQVVYSGELFSECNYIKLKEGGFRLTNKFDRATFLNDFKQAYFYSEKLNRWNHTWNIYILQWDYDKKEVTGEMEVII